MPDGASALYDSEAVAGVVNVILRRDYCGVTTSGQLGASTDDGYFRQQADIVGGARWAGGGRNGSGTAHSPSVKSLGKASSARAYCARVVSVHIVDLR